MTCLQSACFSKINALRLELYHDVLPNSIKELGQPGKHRSTISGKDAQSEGAPGENNEFLFGSQLGQDLKEINEKRRILSQLEPTQGSKNVFRGQGQWIENARRDRGPQLYRRPRDQLPVGNIFRQMPKQRPQQHQRNQSNRGKKTYHHKYPQW